MSDKFGAGRGSDTEGAGARKSRPTTTAAHVQERQRVRAALDHTLGQLEHASEVVGRNVPEWVEGWAERNGLKVTRSEFAPSDQLFIVGTIEGQGAEMVSKGHAAANRQEYATIVADPPWRYTKNPTELRSGGRGASAEHVYPTMTTEEIAAIPVAGMAADNAHLYLWVTNPVLVGTRSNIRGETTPSEIVRAWGFEPMTLLTWHKTGPPGMGFYWRGQTEHVIFAVRGNLPIPAEKRIRNLFESQRRGHSEKPDSFLDLVEQVSPGPYLEMFSRRARLGWDTWGDEALHGTELVA